MELNKIPTLTVSPASTSTTTQADCPACGGMGYFRADVEVGHSQFGKLLPCDHPAHHAVRLAALVKVSGLAEIDADRRLSDIKRIAGNEAMLDAAQALLDNPYGWLWIHGGPGNAKTEVLIAIVNESTMSGRGPSVYAKFSTIVDYMRDAFAEKNQRAKDPGTNLGYIDRFEKLKAVKILAIDEMDKARATPFMQDFRFDFLDERYRQGVAGQTVTLFASNLNPATMPDPIWDRVRDGRFKVIHNQASSARPNMRKG